MKIIHNNLSKSSVVLIFASIPSDKFIILLPNDLAIIPGKQLIFPIIYYTLVKYLYNFTYKMISTKASPIASPIASSIISFSLPLSLNSNANI